MAFGVDDARPGRARLFRIVSLAGIVASFVGIGFFFRRGDAASANMLIFVAVAFAGLFAWSWTGSLFDLLRRGTRYVEGVEGDDRHEWYAFKGVRMRVFLDDNRQPWFALNEIAYVLGLKDDDKTFRNYGPDQLATPAPASVPCLSESGLRRLIRYSAHPDARALGLWLERDVLRVMRNRADKLTT